MRLREYLESCKTGRGTLLITIGDDDDWGTDNLNRGKYWESRFGNWDLDDASGFDAFDECSDELRESLLNAFILEVDSHVDISELMTDYDNTTRHNSRTGYLCIVLNKYSVDPQLVRDYFKEHGKSRKHYFMSFDKSWPCTKLTKDEYQKILDIWNKDYEIRGNKTHTYNVRTQSRALMHYALIVGFKTITDEKIPHASEYLEKAEEIQKEMDNKDDDKGTDDYGMLLDTLIEYVMIKSLEVIGADREKFLELCEITNNIGIPDGVFNGNYLLCSDDEDEDEYEDED